MSLFLLPGAARAASDWEAIGLERPAWVAREAERRLRLLAALPPLADRVKSQADEYFGSQGPRLVVGIMLDDGLYYSQGFGFRDEQKRHAPDETTVFRVGSLTKVFTGTALLVLRDAGKVALDDLAYEYVPEIDQDSAPGPLPCGSHGQPPCHLPVQLRHLLSHTSGLPNQMNPPEVGLHDWLDELEDTSLRFWPGSFAAYSGVGTETTGLIVERVEHKPYAAAVTAILLRPLGMDHSYFDHGDVPARRLAQKYRLSWSGPPVYKTPRFTANDDWDHPRMLTAAGNLFSSIWDLARFDAMFLSMKAPAGILKRETLAAATTPLVTSSGASTAACKEVVTTPDGTIFSGCQEADDFGANWYVGEAGILQHNGSFGGEWGSDTVLSPGRRLGAVALVSTEPYPQLVAGAQSGEVDPGFISTVSRAVLQAGTDGGAAEAWEGSGLAVGVARFLWLTGAARGKEPAATFQAKLLDQLSASYRAAQHLDAASVDAWLAELQQGIDGCSTFRVRKAPSAHKLLLRLSCTAARGRLPVAYDVTLSTSSSAAHRLDDIAGAGLTDEPY